MNHPNRLIRYRLKNFKKTCRKHYIDLVVAKCFMTCGTKKTRVNTTCFLIAYFRIKLKN